MATNTNAQGVTIVDISTPATPVELSSYNTNSDCNGIFYDGTNVFGACEDDAQELQIVGPTSSLPDFITLTGSVDLASDNTDVFVSGSIAYVSTEDNGEGLTLVDISTPATPTQ